MTEHEDRGPSSAEQAADGRTATADDTPVVREDATGTVREDATGTVREDATGTVHQDPAGDVDEVVTRSDDAGPTIRRVASRATSRVDPDGPVTTGVLAADATTRVQLARRRRWLVGGGVLGLVVVLAYVLVTTLQADQARDAARAQALADAAEVDFARVVVDRAESYETPAASVVVDVRSLRAALEEHLTTTDRTPGELSELVTLTTTSLRSTADGIAELTDRPLPPLEGPVDEADRDAVLGELDQLRVEADALVAEVRAAAAAAEEWSAAVTTVDEALAAHVEVVESKTGGGSPTALVTDWQAEIPPLERLRAAATDAERVPGLERWAAAHVAYAQGTLDFVEQAVQLLEDGEVDAYNELFEATFDDDPFDLVAEALAGAEEALGAGPLVELATVDERARIVDAQLRTVETTVAGTLGEDG